MLKNIISEEINRAICESEWNFHNTDKEIEGYGKPYQSDNRYMMKERHTGHFGSGTYFSTYDSMFDRRDYKSKYVYGYHDNPEFIKVGNNVYRVDFDIYKNLYRVENKKMGDLLYTTLRELNDMFNKVSDENYKLSIDYQIILNNSKYLGLKCPSYKELIRMMQKYYKSDNIQSFSTYFMEYNGYNGVNVSGIPKYDNTTHGSVIYDLSKKSLTPIKTEKNIKGSFSSGGNTIGRNSDWIEDGYTSSLAGDTNFPIYKLKEYDANEKRRILKNFILTGRMLNESEIEDLDEDTLKYYMKLIYHRKPDTKYHSFDEYLNDNNIIDLIEKHKLYYWVNYIPSDNNYSDNTMLVNLIKHAWFNNDYPIDDEDKESEYMNKYINMLLKFLKRKPTEKEKNIISEYI